MHEVLARSDLLHDLAAVVLLVAAELDRVQTAYLDVAGQGFGVLRDFWLFGTISLQVELRGIGDLGKDQSFGEVDSLELFFSLTSDRVKVEVVLPETQFALSCGRLSIFVLGVLGLSSDADSQTLLQEFQGVVSLVDEDLAVEDTLKVHTLELDLDVSLVGVEFGVLQGLL